MVISAPTISSYCESSFMLYIQVPSADNVQELLELKFSEVARISAKADSNSASNSSGGCIQCVSSLYGEGGVVNAWIDVSTVALYVQANKFGLYF